MLSPEDTVSESDTTVSSRGSGAGAVSGMGCWGCFCTHSAVRARHTMRPRFSPSHPRRTRCARRRAFVTPSFPSMGSTRGGGGFSIDSTDLASSRGPARAACISSRVCTPSDPGQFPVAWFVDKAAVDGLSPSMGGARRRRRISRSASRAWLPSSKLARAFLVSDGCTFGAAECCVTDFLFGASLQMGPDFFARELLGGDVFSPDWARCSPLGGGGGFGLGGSSAGSGGGTIGLCASSAGSGGPLLSAKILVNFFGGPSRAWAAMRGGMGDPWPSRPSGLGS